MCDNQFTLFTNGSYCLGGDLIDDHLVISEETGRILRRTGYIGGEIVDLEGNIVVPGFLELHTNGVNGFRYADLQDEHQYDRRLKETAEHYVSQGVTGFWAAVRSTSPQVFQQVLPSLRPRSLSPSGAHLHGAHVVGPYFSPPASDANVTPSLDTIYGASGLSSIKLATIMPSDFRRRPLFDSLTVDHLIRVSLGYGPTPYAEGLAALEAGATCLTHPLNATAMLQSGEPNLAGLISLPPKGYPKPPYYTLVADGYHLHPATAALLYQAAPSRAILVTQGAELMHYERGLVRCPTLLESVRNLMAWTGCSLPEAVRTVTENVATMMGVDQPSSLDTGGVGVLTPGNRADLVVLSEHGELLQTWVAGRKVWESESWLGNA